MEAIANYIRAVIAHWPIALVIIASALGLLCLFLVFRTIVNRRFLMRRDMVWLEIIPPTRISMTPEATEQLFSVLHGARAARHIKDKILGRLPVMSFEITSTRKDGVRYLVHVEALRSHSLQKTITSYIPDSLVREVAYTSPDYDKVTEFKQTGHYILPITLTSKFERHDPLSYVTGAMANLADGEEVTLQIVAAPIRLREAEILSHKILGNENILQQVGGGKLAKMSKATSLVGKITSGITDWVSDTHTGMTSGYSEHYSAM